MVDVKKKKTNLILKLMLVFQNGIEVSIHSNTIWEHLFFMVEKGIGAKVVHVVDLFGDGGASATTSGVFRRGSHGYGCSLWLGSSIILSPSLFFPLIIVSVQYHWSFATTIFQKPIVGIVGILNKWSMRMRISSRSQLLPSLQCSCPVTPYPKASNKQWIMN